MRLKLLAAVLPAVLVCLPARAAPPALDRAEFDKLHKALQLPAGEPHSLRGIEDGSLLLTVLSAGQ
jgi:hypothetical protein